MLPFGRSSPPSAQLPPEDSHDLVTPEEAAGKRRRRRLLVGAGLMLVLIIIGVFAGRPGLRAVKVWQARRSADEALRLLDAGKAEEAVVKVQDALMLRGTDPEVMRSVAVFLTRAGHGREAAGFWREIEKGRALTREEQRAYATDLAQSGDLIEAGRRLRLAVPDGSEGIPADRWLRMQIAARENDAAGAAREARRLVDGKTAGTTERQRLDAALVLFNVNDPASQRLGAEALQALAAGGRSAESLDALLALTRQASQEIAAKRARQQDVPEAAAAELSALAGRIEVHPRTQIAQRLLAMQARIIAQPDTRTNLIQKAVDRYGRGSNEELAALAGWLYSQGEFQRVLDVIPPERATGSRAIYLQYLDTLGAFGRWEDIRRNIEEQKFTLDAMVEQMYLARCATQLHQPDTAALRWEAALRAAGANPGQLLSLGRYALADGAPKTAEAALRSAVKAAPGNRSAYEALLGLLETQGRTRDLRATVREMLAIWPEDTAIRNDNAYLGALLGEDLQADRDTARELVRLGPTSLPHRMTLALAELRLGHGLTALETLQVVNPGLFESQAKFLAVYAAVLWETGYEAEARKVKESIPQGQLLPEEKQLAEGIGRKS